MFARNRYSTLLFIVLSMLLSINLRPIDAKICKTIHVRSSVKQFEKLRNCTVIEGSLAIALMHKVSKEDFNNITFPDLIEITDYLLVYQVEKLQNLGRIFPNLTLIRGQELFDKYAIMVGDNIDLKEIGFSNLAYTERGAVSIQNNPELCYVNTIDWNRITDNRPGNDFENNKVECNICDNTSCPKTSSQTKNPTSNNKVTNNRLCWSEGVCQKLCNKECKQQSCYLNKHNECCPDECLGSCYEQQLTPEQANGTKPRPNKVAKVVGTTAHICTICRDVEHEGKCMSKCPDDLYKFKNRRCITKEACILESKIYINSEKRKQIFLKPVKMANGTSVCVADCPDGYMMNPENSHSCIKCKNKCFQECEGGRIEKVESSQKFKKCTSIKGDLIISLHDNSKNLEKILEENLGSIETIHGYLRISKSFSLQTLHFFKSLREIAGESLDRQNYALTVLDNANLEELFWINPNLTQPQLKVNRGKVFFQLNPKLCLYKIHQLANYSNVQDFPSTDVPDFSNGDKAICVISKIFVNLVGASDETLLIQWTQFKPNDFRTLISYDIWYRETEQENITSYFENRDVCSQNDWNYLDFDVDPEKSVNAVNESTVISNLKPATKYAFFIKANVLVNQREYSREPAKTGISDIVYFTTYPAQPNKPDNLILTSPSFSEIEATWQPPAMPNGRIVYYHVVVEKVEDIQLEVTNCDEKQSQTYAVYQETDEKQSPKDKQIPNSPQHCCKCSIKNEDKQFEKISLENLLANTLYYTTNQTLVKSLNDTYLDEVIADELMISLNATRFRKQLVMEKLSDTQRRIVEKMIAFNNSHNYQMGINDFKSFNLSINQIKELKLNVTNLAKIDIDDKQITQFDLTETELNLYHSYKAAFKELKPNPSEFRKHLRRMIRSVTMNEAHVDNPNDQDLNNQTIKEKSNLFVKEFNTTETRIKIGGLEQYTHYKIKVSACQNVSVKLLEQHKQCSTYLSQSINTQIVGGANDLVNVTLNLDDIVEKGTVHIKWEEPEKPNGQIKFFKLEYTHGSDQKNPIELCVAYPKYVNESRGRILKNLQPGDYKYRIMAVSTGGRGNWTQIREFVVPEKNTVLKWYLIVLFVVIVVIVISFTYSYYYIRKKKESIYASVNPDYVEYEPDDWEVEREKIIYDLENELGKGNYGVVYDGVFKKSINEIIRVAVKTSSKSKADLGRNKLLEEASTMKKIKCYHVISLIGVVSKGIPVLVLMEMMDAGDLKNYLRNHRPDDENNGDDDEESIKAKKNKSLIDKTNSNNNNSDSKRVTYHQILRWAVQIADGMAYLSTNKFVHRDLAARNCLLSADLVAKVGDFGMVRDVYYNNYYKKTTRDYLPVRWSAPETLRDGVFTSQSDVWSYGIVLYEMVTLGCQPYQGLPNRKVLDFIKNYGKIDIPDGCPENIQNIMQMCWTKKPKERPTFIEIIKMLLPHAYFKSPKDESEKSVEKFKEEFEERSFYYEHLKKTNSDETSSGSRSKKDLKKEEYSNEKNVLDDDGSDEPLTKLNLNGELKGDPEFQQLYNDSSNNSEKHCLSDFTSKGSDLTAELNAVEQQNSEFSENDSNYSLSSQSKPEEIIVEMHNVDKERTELNRRHQLTNFKNSSLSSLNNKKSREESISYQSSSGTSTSNEENFSLAADLIHQPQINNSKIPINGNLPNGNIIFNN